MQTRMGYKYIYVVVRNTNPKPLWYEKLSTVWITCIWQYWCRAQGDGLLFGGFRAGTGSRQTPLLCSRLACSGDSFPWQSAPGAAMSMIHHCPKVPEHTFCCSCSRTGGVRFPSDNEWRWQKLLSNTQRPWSNGEAEVIGTADPASSGKLLWIRF